MRKNKSLNLLLQHTRDTVYVKQIDDGPSSGTITFISDNIEKLLGYRAEDFLRNRNLWSSILHPEDIKGIEKKERTIFKSGKPARLTYRIRHKKNRRYRWVEDIITPQFDEHGQTIGLAGSLIDITKPRELKKSSAGRQEHFTDLFEKASVGVYHTTPDGQLLYANNALVKMLGYRSNKELMKIDLNKEGFANPKSREDFLYRIDKEGVVVGLESVWKKKDGNLLFVRESAHVVRDEDGNVLYYEGSAEDLTEMKLAEHRIVRLNQISRTLFDINQLIIRNSTPKVFFNEACNLLVSDGKYRSAWIGVLDESRRVVHPIAWNGIEDGSLKEIIVIASDKADKSGLIREAIRTGLACVCNDLQNDPAFKAWRSEARRKGYRSAAAFPIRVSGRVVGVVNIFAEVPDRFTTEETHLLSELADSIGVALWTIEVRARENAANEAVKDKEFWLTESQRVARVGSYVLDIKSRTIASSPMLDEISGVGSDFSHDLKSFVGVVHPEEREHVYQYFQETFAKKESCDIEFRIVRPSDEEQRWIWCKGELMRDSSGKPVSVFGTVQDITDRKRIEEEEQQEKIFLRTLIDNLPSAVFVKDKDYRKTIVNLEHVRRVADHLGLLGLNPEEKILGKTDFDLYPKELAEQYFADDQRVIRDGESVLNKVEKGINLDGRVSWLLVSKLPLRDKDGTILGLVGITTEITAQKEAEEAQKRERILLRTLIDNLPHSIYVKDANYRKIMANPTNVMHAGLQSEAEILGKNDFDVYPKELAEKFFVDDQRVIREGKQVLDREEYVFDSQGKKHWQLTTKVPLRDEDGKIVGLVGIGTDITERKAIEDRLCESEERFRAIFENASIGIYRSTPDGRVLFANPAMAKILGFQSIDELAKYNLEEDGHYPAEFPRSKFRELIETDGSVAGLETKKIRKDGSSFWVRENAHVIRDQSGRIAYYEGTIEDITERKRAEEELEHERTLLRTLIENLPSSIFIKDKEYRKTLVNRRHLIHIVRDLNRPDLGSESAILGKTDFEIYPKEIAEEYFLDDQKVIRDGQMILDREELRDSPDGKRRWVSISKIPLHDKSGEVVGLLGIATDITDRKVAEEAVRASEAELRTLFASMKDVILVVDKDGRYLKASPTDDSQLYKPASELIGKTNHEVFPEEQADFFLSVIHRTLETGQAQNVEYAINIRGEEKWRTATVSPLTNDSVLWVARDITDRKFMEKEIRDSEKKYRELVENALVGVYRTTLSGKIIYDNKAMADMLEYDSQEELMSRTSFAWYKDVQEREVFTKELRNHGKTGKSMEVEFITKTGKVKNVLISASLDGEIISGMAKDITEIRSLERQFLQTQKLEGLGNIAAGIAHDFNNILGVILGYADLLRQTAFDQNKFQRGTQAIMKSAERGKSLVKQLLTFARKTEITFGSVRVNDIASEIEKLMMETFPKTIIITTRLGSDLPVISGDSTQIHQVLLNICLNARDAMPKGGKLTISTDAMAHEILLSKFPEATARSYVQIRIEDNGMGMDEETRRRIFEPFFTTKEIGKGTGLGLSVVYGIVQSHRGFVDVASKPKIGTTFDIYFPVYEDSVEGIEVVEPPQEEILGGTDTVLVIEDEEMLRDLLVSILESKGYKVLTARDGEEGVQTFRKHEDRIALVLSDLGLPKLSGEEIVSYIKQIDPSAKIVITSGFIDPDVRSGLESAGVRDFIQKPYRAHEVLKVVRAVINGHKA